MEKQLKVVQSNKQPSNIHVLWLNTNDNLLYRYDVNAWNPINKIGFPTVEEYDSNKEYEAYSLVSYLGNGYIASRYVPQHKSPQFYSDYWVLYASKGDKGDQGNSGYSGNIDELEIVNNLTEGGPTSALSAEQGKTLYLIIQKIQEENAFLDSKKVNKEEGKGLSSNDLTDEYKQQIDEVIELVTTGEVVTDNMSHWVGEDINIPVSGNGVYVAINEAKTELNTQIENKVDKVDGKGLSTNDFTDEYKATIETAVQPEDYAKKLTAGFADNLVGRGDITPSVFTYRPTGGTLSIGDGVARIKSIKGNTIIWNQLHPDPQMTGVFGITGTDGGIVDGFRRITSPDGLPTNLKIQRNVGAPKGIIGHKYLVTFIARTDGDSIRSYENGVLDKSLSASVTSENIIHYSYIGTAKTTNWMLHAILATNATYLDCRYPQYHDLTQMFGAGNEPSTVEEFRALFPNEYYEYNAGEFCSLSADGIKTTGFNQWDEEWTIGLINVNNGNLSISSNAPVASKDYIRVLPDVDYYFNFSMNPRIAFYDQNKKFINCIYTNSKGLVHTPFNAHYIRFSCYSTYGSVYKNDICINLSHTGYRNGEYEPYKEFTRELGVIKKYFPDGMKSAGTVYDEITSTKAITRIGVVDLGELSWYSQTVNERQYFYADINDIKIGSLSKVSNIRVLKLLEATTLNNVLNTADFDNSIAVHNVGHRIYVRRTTNTNAASFKTAMIGVMLYYELANPIEVEFEELINLDYEASDFGTETALLDEASAPFAADIIYQFNATDTIRNNMKLIESLTARVLELENQLAAQTTIESLTE